MRGQKCLIVFSLLAACRHEASPQQVAPGASTGPAANAEAKARSNPGDANKKLSQPSSLVRLDGTGTEPPEVRGGSTARIYARALRVWIYDQPRQSATKIGYLRAGAAAPIGTAEVTRGNGCEGGWYPILPQGFVCLDAKATLDRADPIVQATIDTPANRFRKLPYIYGTVRKPGPFYARLPTRAELAQTEPEFEQRIAAWLDLKGEEGAGYAQEVWAGGDPVVDPKVAWTKRVSDPLPAFLQNGKFTPNIRNEPRYRDALSLGVMPRRLGHGILQTFLSEGRRYALTTDLVIVPTDRLRPIRGSDFHGVTVGKDIGFPFGFIRGVKARYTLYKKGVGLKDGGPTVYRAVIKLTGRQEFFSGRLHYETADGKWLSDQDLSRVEVAKKMPAWATRGEKWIDVNLSKQLLVLYEGVDPVYATLISSGEAGLDDPEHTTATPRGIFRIHTKHISTTMSSDEVGEEFELRDVPYVQYFEKGYALHGAYWHDRFGLPKSHGCINLSPEDARRIFHWTEPGVPLGWHGAQSANTGTVLFIHP
ncbi:MAG: L,D-transpeptidase [Polyangiaceae bacterium]|nr:L,D-transpeptidase [Polyangiaceae bacterium]